MAIIVPYLDFDKKRLLLNSFFISQFNYCRLTWMCHNCTNNSKINRLYDRYLRLIYFDRKYYFEELLEKDNSVSIHYINFRVLAVEMYNGYLRSSRVLMSESFPLKQELNTDLGIYQVFTFHKSKVLIRALKILEI